MNNQQSQNINYNNSINTNTNTIQPDFAAKTYSFLRFLNFFGRRFQLSYVRELGRKVGLFLAVRLCYNGCAKHIVTRERK